MTLPFEVGKRTDIIESMFGRNHFDAADLDFKANRDSDTNNSFSDSYSDDSDSDSDYKHKHYEDQEIYQDQGGQQAYLQRQVP